MFSGVLPVGAINAVAYPTDTVASTQAPWVGAIYLGTSGTELLNFDRICTGSLIDPRHVLTAAHCVAGQHPSDYTVALGGSNLYEATHYQVTDYEIHPRYTVPTNDDEISLPHDIAVLHLSEPVVGIKPIDISPRDDTRMRNGGMVLYGYGVDHNGAISEYLGYTKQRDYSAQAKKWFKGFNTKNQIAAGLLRRGEGVFSAACFGDSGGPLVGFGKKDRPYILGVTSHGSPGGANSCRSDSPAVYTRASQYAKWIASARSKMAERAPRSRIHYVVRDAVGDAEREDGPSADISYVSVSSSQSSLTARVYVPQVPQSEFRQSVVLSLSDVSAAGSQRFAYVAASGVYNIAEEVVCQATKSEGMSTYGYFVSLTVPADCLYSVFGRTRFDVSVAVGVVRPSADVVVSGVDTAKVSYVSLWRP